MPMDRVAYDPNKPLYFRKAMRFEGGSFERGDQVPVAGVPLRRLAKLWEGRYIDHECPDPPPSPTPVPLPEPSEPVDDSFDSSDEEDESESVEDEEEDDEDEEEGEESPVIKAAGGGWYVVTYKDMTERVQGRRNAEELADMMKDE